MPYIIAITTTTGREGYKHKIIGQENVIHNQDPVSIAVIL